jgi:hypothetical protein
MRRPKSPTETERPKAYSNEPPSRKKPSETHEEFNRTVPERRNPEYVKQHDRAVNEDEQLKEVNYREDNAQSTGTVSNDAASAASPEPENRIEAGDDYSEVNPRPRKVN